MLSILIFPVDMKGVMVPCAEGKVVDACYWSS